jgi:hypothetical protein
MSRNADSTVRIGGLFSLMLFPKQYLELAERGLRGPEGPRHSLRGLRPAALSRTDVKDLILACYHISELQPLAGEGRTPVEPPDWKHKFETLVPALTKALQTVGFGTPFAIDPKELHSPYPSKLIRVQHISTAQELLMSMRERSYAGG